MSSEAITRRLRQTDQLRKLSLSLMKAKKVSDEKAISSEKIIMPTKYTKQPKNI